MGWVFLAQGSTLGARLWRALDLLRGAFFDTSPYKRLGGCGLIGQAGKINELAESAGIDEPIRETCYVWN